MPTSNTDNERSSDNRGPEDAELTSWDKFWDAFWRALGGKVAALIVSAVVGAVGLLVVWLVNREDSASSPEPPIVEDTVPPPDPSVPEDAVEVMVVWGGAELTAFRQVVNEYDDDEVVVTPVGEDIGEALDTRFANGNPPDVAIIPQPALVRRYVAEGRLQSIDDEVVRRFPDQWNSFVTARIGNRPAEVYGAWVKGTHKSIFWYQTDALDGEPADSWNELTDLVRDNVDNGAPLALPAGNRWLLTDWFENQFVSLAPDLYDRLANGSLTDWDRPEVRQALSDMAELWGIPGVFVGGPEGAKDMVWQDVARLLGDTDAALGFVPSFLAGEIQDLPPKDQPTPLGFPRALGGQAPLVVGGDVAVVPRQSTQGQAFVEWLTNDEALNLWSELDPGYLTPNGRTPYRVDAQPPPDDSANVHVFLTALLRSPDGPLHFDLSDQFGVVTEGDPRGVWNIFAAFFDDVTVEQPDVSCAIERVIERVEAESRGDEEWPPADCP